MVAIDMRGRGGPMVTVQLAHELRSTPEEPIGVLTDRQSVVEYVMAWCKQTGNRIISVDTIGGDVRVVVSPPRSREPKRRRGSRTRALRTI